MAHLVLRGSTSEWLFIVSRRSGWVARGVGGGESGCSSGKNPKAFGGTNLIDKWVTRLVCGVGRNLSERQAVTGLPAHRTK